MQVGSTQGGPVGMASAITKAPSAASYDPKDTNRDGVVSASEEMADLLKQPVVKIQESTAAANNLALGQYGQSGAMNASTNAASGLVDGYA